MFEKLQHTVLSISAHFQDDMDFVEMYDIKRDPYQLTNLAINANQEEHSQKQGQVSRLRECRGWRQCLRSRDAT